MKSHERMAAIVAEVRRAAQIDRTIATGQVASDDQARMLMRKVKCHRVIFEHLSQLDQDAWLEWCAAELQSAHMISDTYGIGAIDA